MYPFARSRRESTDEEDPENLLVLQLKRVASFERIVSFSMREINHGYVPTKKSVGMEGDAGIATSSSGRRKEMTRP